MAALADEGGEPLEVPSIRVSVGPRKLHGKIVHTVKVGRVGQLQRHCFSPVFDAEDDANLAAAKLRLHFFGDPGDGALLSAEERVRVSALSREELLDEVHRSSNANKGNKRFVGACRNRSKWQAEIWVAGKNVKLGSWDTEEEAAEAYDRAAVQKLGRDAHLNFPEQHGFTRFTRWESVAAALGPNAPVQQADDDEQQDDDGEVSQESVDSMDSEELQKMIDWVLPRLQKDARKAANMTREELEVMIRDDPPPSSEDGDDCGDGDLSMSDDDEALQALLAPPPVVTEEQRRAFDAARPAMHPTPPMSIARLPAILAEGAKLMQEARRGPAAAFDSLSLSLRDGPIDVFNGVEWVDIDFPLGLKNILRDVKQLPEGIMPINPIHRFLHDKELDAYGLLQDGEWLKPPPGLTKYEAANSLAFPAADSAEQAAVEDFMATKDPAAFATVLAAVSARLNAADEAPDGPAAAGGACASAWAAPSAAEQGCGSSGPPCAAFSPALHAPDAPFLAASPPSAAAAAAMLPGGLGAESGLATAGAAQGAPAATGLQPMEWSPQVPTPPRLEDFTTYATLPIPRISFSNLDDATAAERQAAWLAKMRAAPRNDDDPVQQICRLCGALEDEDDEMLDGLVQAAIDAHGACYGQLLRARFNKMRELVRHGEQPQPTPQYDSEGFHRSTEAFVNQLAARLDETQAAPGGLYGALIPQPLVLEPQEPTAADMEIFNDFQARLAAGQVSSIRL